jgi:hypothetical protein
VDEVLDAVGVALGAGDEEGSKEKETRVWGSCQASAWAYEEPLGELLLINTIVSGANDEQKLPFISYAVNKFTLIMIPIKNQAA